MILKVYLYNFITESEHYSVFSAHPFFDVDGARRILQFISLVQFVSLNELLLFLWIVVLLQVGLKVLKQSDFLLNILRVIREVVLLHHILLLVRCDCFSFIVV